MAQAANLHILIIEDDRDHVDLILRAFRNDPEPFRISVAGTIRQAQEITGRDSPDLIITDWNLPDGKGIDILTRVDGTVTKPLIVMTGHGDERLAVEIMKSGAVDYIVKSATTFEDLPNISRRALRFWDNLHDRLRAEKEVQETQKRLADILALLPDAVLAIDKDGVIIAWNNAMERLAGVPAADMLGKGDHEYSIPFYGERRPILIDLVLEENPEIENHYDYIQRDGDRITSEKFVAGLLGGRGAYLWGTASPLYDSAGMQAGAIEVLRDITERKNAGAALEESEKKFRTLLENVPDLILVHRDGIILYVNQLAREITGYSLDELLHQPISRFVAPEYQDRIAAAIARRKSGEAVEPYVAEILTKSGKRLTVMVRGCGIEFEGSPASLNVLTDITERMNAERALQESEVRFRDLFNNMSAGVAIYQATPDGTDFIIRDVNRGVERIEQVKKEEITGRSLLEVFPGVRELGLFEVLQRVARTGVAEALPASMYRDNRIEGWRENYVYRLPSGEIVAIYEDVTERKLAEDALRESEVKYRTLIENSGTGIVIVDRQGTYQLINNRAAALMGAPPDRIVGKTMFDFLPEEVARRYLARNCEVMDAGKGEEYEETFELKTGTKSFHIIDQCLFDHAGQCVALQSISVDITEQKRAEQALRESEIRFRALIQNSSDIIRILDQDRRVIYESPSAGRILGYPPGFLIGQDPMEYVHPDDLDRVKRDFQEVSARTNKGIPTEFRVRKADGDYIWVDSIAVNLLEVPGVNGIVITTRPIQQRKEAEQSLSKSEERLRLALEGADAGFWDWHLPSGQAVFSDRFYSMLGYTPGEFPATYEAWISLMHPDDRDRVLQSLQQQIQKKQLLIEIEYRIRAKEGNWLWILGRGKIVEWNDKGDPVRMTGVNIDITNRRLMESEIRSLNAVLEQRVRDRTDALSKANEALEEENAQRVGAEKKLKSSLDEKTILLKEIHHRVKNNLQIIASLLNLQSRYVKDEPTLAAIRESQNRVRAMALVHEKLYRSEDLSHIDLHEYIRFLGTGLFQFYDAKSRDIRFRLDMHEVDVEISTAIPLGLILNELISNSLKYAFPAGKAGEVFIGIQKVDHILTIQFHDNGIGIPESVDWKETQSLGLRLVNTLVDQLNGTIELDRTDGTRFTLVLHEKNEPGHPVGGPASGSGTGG